MQFFIIKLKFVAGFESWRVFFLCFSMKEMLFCEANEKVRFLTGPNWKFWHCFHDEFDGRSWQISESRVYCLYACVCECKCVDLLLLFCSLAMRCSYNLISFSKGGGGESSSGWCFDVDLLLLLFRKIVLHRMLMF